jgi:exodeoxyribonuclease V alpha subunit
VGEIKVGENIFREGDKVIQLSNNYELNVFNGDIGRVASIDRTNRKMYIRFGEEVIEFESTDMGDLDLAYSITIHKSQGSEFDFVILPLMNHYFRMLYRNLIYTGLTRAKKLAVFIGDRKSMTTAVRSFNYKPRQTSLREILAGEIVITESFPL